MGGEEGGGIVGNTRYLFHVCVWVGVGGEAPSEVGGQGGAGGGGRRQKDLPLILATLSLPYLLIADIDKVQEIQSKTRNPRLNFIHKMFFFLFRCAEVKSFFFSDL